MTFIVGINDLLSGVDGIQLVDEPRLSDCKWEQHFSNVKTSLYLPQHTTDYKQTLLGTAVCMMLDVANVIHFQQAE